VVARAERRLPAPTVYTLIEPQNEDALTAGQREIWESLRPDAEGDEAEDGTPQTRRSSLFLDSEGVRAMLGARAELVREEGGEAVYRFQPTALNPDEPAPDFIDRISGEIALREGRVAWIRLFAERSFKPHPAARINTFDIRMEYAPDPRFDAPLLRATRAEVSGSAMFQSFEQDMVMEILEFEPAVSDPAL
jgi:hypothetical protein